MSMRSLEAAMLVEARELTGNKKLRQKDIQEWSSTPIKAHDGETVFTLPKLGVYVSVLNSAVKTGEKE